MPTDLERLVVQIEANQAKFQKELNRANRTANRQARAIETRFAKMNRKISGSLLAFGKGLVGPLGIGAGILAVRGLGDAARGAVAQFDMLSKAARTVGIGTDLFQGLEFAGIEEGVDGVGKALERFTIRAGEAVIGKGEMVESLRRLNPQLLDSIRLARSQEERVRLVADAVAQAATAEQKATLVKAAFGEEAIGLVRVFEDGAKGLDDYIRRARDLGLVVDRHILDNAEEMANKLGVASEVVDRQLKQAFIELTPIIVGTARAIADIATAINSVIDSTKALDERQTRFLERDARAIQRLMELNPEGISFLDSDRLETDLAAIEAELARRRESEGITIGPGGGGSKAPVLPGGNDRDAAAEVIADLRHELELLGALDHEREIANNLRRAGAEATAAQRAEIAALTGELHAETEAQQRVAEATQQVRDIAQDALGGFISDLREGKSAADAFAGALDRIADRLFDQALNTLFAGPAGGAGGRGLFGGFLVPGILHRGGVAGRDGYGHARAVPAAAFAAAPRYHGGGTAGIRPGEVPAILQRGEVVIPRGRGAGAVGAAAVTVVQNIDFSGADPATVAQLRAQLPQVREEAKAGAVAAVRQMIRTDPSFRRP